VVVGGHHDRTGTHLVAPGVKRGEEASYRLQRRPVARIDQRHLHTQLTGQTPAPERTVAPVQFIRHCEHDQRGEPQAQHRLGDHQVGVKARDVENHHHRVRPPVTLQLTQEGVSRDDLIQAARRQPVDSRQVHNIHRSRGRLDDAGPPLDGDPRVVRHALAEPGEVVEEGGLTRIRGTHQSNQRAVARRALPDRPRRQGGGRRRRAQFESRTPAASSALRTQRHDAVSLRRATREPSTL